MPSTVCSVPTAYKQLKPPPSAHTEGSGASNAEEWKLAMARTNRRKRFPLELEVHNCFTTLQTEEERPATSGKKLELSKAAQSATCITSSTKKR